MRRLTALLVGVTAIVGAGWIIPAEYPPPRLATTSSTVATVARPTVVTASPTTTSTSSVRARWTWNDLADCETGDHHTRPDGTWDVIPGTARWTAHDRLHQGGVQFAVSTWDRYRLRWLPHLRLPVDAHLATPAQQIAVARKVLELEGPGAWPTCSYVIGMRTR